MTNDQLIAYLQNRVVLIDKKISDLNSQKTKILSQIAKLQETFSSKVYAAHQELMAYFQANYYNSSPTDNNFLIPYRPNNFNIIINDDYSGASHSAEDYSACIYPNIGGSTNKWECSGNFTFFYIYGYFYTSSPTSLVSDSTSMSHILGSCWYNVGEISVNACSIFDEIRTIKPPFGNLGYLRTYLNTTAYNNVVWTINKLSNWAKTTGFLAPLTLCSNYYWSSTGYGLMPPYNLPNAFANQNLDVAQTPIASTKDPTIMLPNILQRNYFDRLYDFMKIKKYTTQQAVDTIKNFTI